MRLAKNIGLAAAITLVILAVVGLVIGLMYAVVTLLPDWAATLTVVAAVIFVVTLHFLTDETEDPM